MPRLRSRFSKPPRRPRRWSSARRRSAIRRWPLLDRDGVYGAPRFHMAARKAGLKALVGAELTIRTQQQPYSPHPPSLWRLPVLVGSREGYRNLCRLITRMKAGAPKGKSRRPAARSASRISTAPPAGSSRSPAGPCSAARGTASAGCSIAWSACSGAISVYVELQRHLQRDEEADNHALVTLAVGVSRAADRDQRRALRDAGGAAALRRAHLHPPQDRRSIAPGSASRTTPSAT